jgi:hypothetical protein
MTGSEGRHRLKGGRGCSRLPSPKADTVSTDLKFGCLANRADTKRQRITAVNLNRCPRIVARAQQQPAQVEQWGSTAAS